MGRFIQSRLDRVDLYRVASGEKNLIEKIKAPIFLEIIEII